MVSPFSVHQQQLAMLAQKQSLLMAAAAKSSGVSQTNILQLGSGGINLPAENWGNIGSQVPGMMIPVAQPQKYMQMGNIQPSHPTGSSAPYPTPPRVGLAFN
ncbi:hypothetical protein F0562_018420 [Nyssa sinensis]|uniref:Uncharacterized protein n=1 Tax=Nyssa sinensis TaxID=561372 RepID=A0A5J4ZA90_9ASTE|nr:hypothetical protein F0562_018420 [Nyssa sinensis]